MQWIDEYYCYCIINEAVCHMMRPLAEKNTKMCRQRQTRWPRRWHQKTSLFASFKVVCASELNPFMLPSQACHEVSELSTYLTRSQNSANQHSFKPEVQTTPMAISQFVVWACSSLLSLAAQKTLQNQHPWWNHQKIGTKKVITVYTELPTFLADCRDLGIRVELPVNFYWEPCSLEQTCRRHPKTI